MSEHDADVRWPDPAEDPPVEPDEPWDKSGGDAAAPIPPAPVVPPVREP